MSASPRRVTAGSKKAKKAKKAKKGEGGVAASSDELVTLEQAARLVGVSSTALRRRVKRGTLETESVVRQGRKVQAVRFSKLQRLYPSVVQPAGLQGHAGAVRSEPGTVGSEQGSEQKGSPAEDVGRAGESQELQRERALRVKAEAHAEALELGAQDAERRLAKAEERQREQEREVRTLALEMGRLEGKSAQLQEAITAGKEDSKKGLSTGYRNVIYTIVGTCVAMGYMELASKLAAEQGKQTLLTERLSDVQDEMEEIGEMVLGAARRADAAERLIAEVEASRDEALQRVEELEVAQAAVRAREMRRFFARTMRSFGLRVDAWFPVRGAVQEERGMTGGGAGPGPSVGLEASPDALGHEPESEVEAEDT